MVIQTSEADGTASAPNRNWLLGALPAHERAHLAASMDLVNAEAGAVLAQPDQPLAHVWFPETATLALSSAGTPRGMDVGTVGREGMASLAAFLGANAEPLRVSCLVPGSLWRLPVEALGKVGAPGNELERILRRYALASFLQASQNAACFGLHSLEQRCARWMLSVNDSVGSTPFPLTHQQLASSLGVRRAGATVVMRELRDAGAVEYTRGRISIVNRTPLEARTCPCYDIIRRQQATLLQGPVS